MEIIGKIAAISIVSVIFCVLLHDINPSLKVLLTLCTCAGILFAGIVFVSPILDFLSELDALSDIPDYTIEPLIKIAAIGFLVRIASGICEDSGERTLGKSVELAGMFISIYVSLPLLSAAVELIKKLVGGTG